MCVCVLASSSDQCARRGVGEFETQNLATAAGSSSLSAGQPVGRGAKLRAPTFTHAFTLTFVSKSDETCVSREKPQKFSTAFFTALRTSSKFLAFSRRRLEELERSIHIAYSSPATAAGSGHQLALFCATYSSAVLLSAPAAPFMCALDLNPHLQSPPVESRRLEGTKLQVLAVTGSQSRRSMMHRIRPLREFARILGRWVLASAPYQRPASHTLKR